MGTRRPGWFHKAVADTISTVRSPRPYHPLTSRRRHHTLVQLAARFANRDRRHDPIEPAVEVIEILLQGGVLQHLSPPTDRDSAQQQPPERHAECRIAALDGVLGVAQQVCQAHLPPHGVAALAAEHIGHPHLGPDRAEQCGYHGLAAAGFDHVQHRHGGDEYPLPPGLAPHPHRGLVGTDHWAVSGGVNPRLNGASS
jgi:hypothetical protein